MPAVDNNIVIFMCFPAGLTYVSFFHVIDFFFPQVWYPTIKPILLLPCRTL